MGLLFFVQIFGKSCSRYSVKAKEPLRAPKQGTLIKICFWRSRIGIKDGLIGRGRKRCE